MNVNLRAARRVTAVAASAFALALAAAACGAGNDTPEGAVENFLDNGIEDFANSFAKGDADKAAEDAEEYFCADDIDSIKEMGAMFEGMSEDEIKELMGEEEIVPEDWSYEIGEVTEEGDTATVEVTMTESGEDTEETFDLVKEDDVWKICGFMS
ncbi:DUF4878 domain-containing protein [Glycomyces paridis]|nr:DUF4878 domain-containing protein [Glycomyces paridis]